MVLNISLISSIRNEFKCMNGETKKVLDVDCPIREWEIEKEGIVKIQQENMIFTKQKCLIMLGGFLVAPLRILASDVNEDWSDRIIPYRINGEFKVEYSTDCEINVKHGYGWGKPVVEITGDGIRDVMIECVPSSDILERERFFANWRLICVGIWTLLLFGYLLGIAIVKVMPVIAILMGLLIAGAFILLGWRIARNNAICRRAVAELQRR